MHTGFHNSPHWKVDHVLSPQLFYLSLNHLISDGAVICFHSTYPRDESTSFLDRHLACSDLLENVSPEIPLQSTNWSGHYLYSGSFSKDLEAYFAQWNHPIADNIACYSKGELLLWFHDAFSWGELQLTAKYTPAKVSQFCAAMAPTALLDRAGPQCF
jgi:hypothetical protein